MLALAALEDGVYLLYELTCGLRRHLDGHPRTGPQLSFTKSTMSAWSIWAWKGWS